MKPTIEQQLIDARPEDAKGNDTFVSRTMKNVGQAGAFETFDKVVRTTSTTNKGFFRMKAHSLHKRFKQLPGYAAALVIMGVIGTAGASAYAAYQWIGPKVTITKIDESNDDNRKEYTIEGQCGEFLSGSDLRYELAQDTSLTDDDVNKVFQNTCAYDAMSSFINSKWKSENDNETVSKKREGDLINIYQYSNIFGGSTESNNDFGITIGKVTALTPEQITISLKLYDVDSSAAFDSSQPDRQYRDYFPEGKEFTRTLAVASEVEVWQDGQKRKMSDIAVGDQVQIVVRTQYPLQYYEDIKRLGLGPRKLLDVVGLIKNDIDTRYIIDSAAQIGDPKIVNKLSGLKPCHNIPQYSCVQVTKQVLGPVYDAEISDAPSNGNEKYLRPDARSEEVELYFLHGRIIKIEGTKVYLQTRGKQDSFMVEFPYDAIKGYNVGQSTGYNVSKQIRQLGVEVGDLVSVVYSQRSTENHLDIKSGDLESFSVILQFQPDGSVLKY